MFGPNLFEVCIMSSLGDFFADSTMVKITIKDHLLGNCLIFFHASNQQIQE